MRSPRDFFRPLALGAPQPVRDIPVRPSRMIHFFDPSNPKMVEKAPGIAKRVDILLGNLEDARRLRGKVLFRLPKTMILATRNCGPGSTASIAPGFSMTLRALLQKRETRLMSSCCQKYRARGTYTSSISCWRNLKLVPA